MEQQMDRKNSWKPGHQHQVPAELMQPIIDPAGWYPSELDTDDWTYILSESEIEEIISAVTFVEQSGVELKDISPKNFLLPTLSIPLKKIRDDVMLGRGFTLLRGIPVEQMSLWQIAAAFLGIGSYLGEARSQNKHGHLLGHVKNLGGDYAKVRGYMTPQAMAFHCDSADILSLCCINPAMKGGEHRICSSVTLYNEMLKARPDIVMELTFRFYLARKGPIPVGESDPWDRLPIFSVKDGYFAGRGISAHMEKGQKIPGVPKYTDKQIEAIEMFKATAKTLAVDINFQPGDISYVTNHTLLHSRTEFEDWPDPGPKRHLLRLWLSNGLRPVHQDIEYMLKGVPIEGDSDPTPLEVTLDK